MLKLRNISGLMLLLTMGNIISMEPSRKIKDQYEPAKKQAKLSSIELLDLPQEMLNLIFSYGICSNFLEKLNKIEDIFDFFRYFNFDIHPDKIETVADFYKHIKFNTKYFNKEDIKDVLNFKSTCRSFYITSCYLIEKIRNKFIQLKENNIKKYKGINLNEALASNLLYPFGNLKSCYRLIIAGADANTRNLFNETLLIKAANFEDVEVVKLTLCYPEVDVNVQDFSGNTALTKAIVQGNVEIAKLILARPNVKINIKDNQGNTALLLAVINYRYEIVKLLLETQDIDLDIKNNAEENVLDIATKDCSKRRILGLIRSCDPELIKASRFGRVEAVKNILERKFTYTNVRDKYGYTALSLAARFGHIEIVKLLLEKGNIDVNAQDEVWSNTALIEAVSKGYTAIVELLLNEQNINIDIENKYNKTALDIAQKKGYQNIISLIEKYKQNN